MLTCSDFQNQISGTEFREVTGPYDAKRKSLKIPPEVSLTSILINSKRQGGPTVEQRDVGLRSEIGLLPSLIVGLHKIGKLGP